MNLPEYPDPHNDDLPPGFNPATHPILAEHVFGITPDKLRRAKLVQHLHQLGPRPTLEFVAELVAEHGIANDVDERLERYAVLDPATVALVGGRHVLGPPLALVPR